MPSIHRLENNIFFSNNNVFISACSVFFLQSKTKNKSSCFLNGAYVLFRVPTHFSLMRFLGGGFSMPNTTLLIIHSGAPLPFLPPPFFFNGAFSKLCKKKKTKSLGFVLQPGKRLKENTCHVTRPADCCRPRHGDFRKPIGQSVRPGFQSSST